MELLTILWLALLIAFLVVEASTVTLISLWFAGGALAALVAALLHAPLWLQVVVFFVVSAALLAFFWLGTRFTPADLIGFAAILATVFLLAKQE